MIRERSPEKLVNFLNLRVNLPSSLEKTNFGNFSFTPRGQPGGQDFIIGPWTQTPRRLRPGLFLKSKILPALYRRIH